jgi:hypothetical protein
MLFICVNYTIDKALDERGNGGFDRAIQQYQAMLNHFTLFMEGG